MVRRIEVKSMEDFELPVRTVGSYVIENIDEILKNVAFTPTEDFTVVTLEARDVTAVIPTNLLRAFIVAEKLI
jgi:ribosome biogenesis protein Nip4